MPLSMPVPVVVVVEEEVFVAAVRCKCHRRNTEAREAALESIPSRKWPCVSPRLPNQTYQQAAVPLLS
jgi:hypothetical protein